MADIALKQKAVRVAMDEVDITHKEKELWDYTRTKFLWECPGFAHILYSMMGGGKSSNQAVFTKQVPIAATDGLYMMLNPETYFKYKLNERVFIAAHEVCHAMLNHPVVFHMYRQRNEVKFSDGTKLPYVEEVMQVAADYIINAMLVESKIGQCPEGCFHDPKLVSHMDPLVEAYRKVYKDTNGGKKLPKMESGQGPGKGQFDQVMKPGTVEGKNPTVAAQERSDGEWKVAVAAAQEANRAQGKLSGSMKHIFGDILEPQVSWQEYILGFFHRKTGSGSWNFRRPDRRLIVRQPDRIYAPSRSGFGADIVVLAVDTSGSISDKTVDMFMAEALGIIEDVQPRVLYIMWCDAKVHRVDECEDYADILHVRGKGAVGRGGTDFRPVFDEIREMGIKPDALVYLTDGYGDFPQVEPDYPVLWGDITKDPKHYPWGEVVEIPKVA
jgi:predicted metal-dependent peptidase